MVKVNFFNEKGNVAVKVRDAVRKQVDSKVANILQAEFDNVQKIKGNYFVEIARDKKTDTPIYMSLSYAVTHKLPNDNVETDSKKAKNEEVLPDLFATEEEGDE